MADTIHAVVRTDNMWGTDVRAGMVSIKYMGEDGETETEIDNGNVLKIGTLMDGESEIRIGSAVAADSAIEEVALVCSPEVLYDERVRAIDQFYNEVGKIPRGYRLHHGDIFSVTKEALDGVEEPEKGNIVEFAAGTKLNVVESATGATVVGEIIAVDIVGRYTYYVIQVA